MNLSDFEKLVIQFMRLVLRFMWATAANTKEDTVYSEAIHTEILAMYEEMGKSISDIK